MSGSNKKAITTKSPPPPQLPGICRCVPETPAWLHCWPPAPNPEPLKWTHRVISHFADIDISKEFLKGYGQYLGGQFYWWCLWAETALVTTPCSRPDCVGSTGWCRSTQSATGAPGHEQNKTQNTLYTSASDGLLHKRCLSEDCTCAAPCWWCVVVEVRMTCRSRRVGNRICLYRSTGLGINPDGSLCPNTLHGQRKKVGKDESQKYIHIRLSDANWNK